jgi:hypothetical protein
MTIHNLLIINQRLFFTVSLVAQHNSFALTVYRINIVLKCRLFYKSAIFSFCQT